MRLIDADRLLNPGYTNMFDEPMKFDMFSRYAIESEPTVEAIPINWLMQKADEYANTNITYDDEPYQFTAQEIALAIALLVRDWRIENAKSNKL